MDKKLVSVNITTYNRAHIISRCLDSIIFQSYKNLEIIIVDDCSTDSTEEMVKEYQQKDNRIKYFKHEKNLGNAYARNTALDKCTGYYVAFMDDDDEWIDDNKIKKQVEIFNRSNDEKLGIICSSVRLIKENQSYFDKIIEKSKNLKHTILKGNGFIYSSTVMTKRNIMIEVAGFDTKLPKGIDSDFYRMCIVRYGYTVYIMPEITTGIHEYGEDRMTLQNTTNSLLKSIQSHYIAIKKYFKYYLLYPSAGLIRLKSLLITILFLLMAKIKN